ncbi:MAG: type II toxin-antitoxin system RelE/ParE family toxin [Methanomicrobia archaeon]|nr:type II toxin-antitoxin system RelE/ParE family toxin [Methanomicrobia archaeon]MCK4433200.1 type II toxin-antitoxin system RelE/ParE family toxin [Methanomicrobia archaeon]MCK4636326.1 type II toxin-antitoxin system RelE/ParE family toxin [Methanomicrobia archaeon]
MKYKILVSRTFQKQFHSLENNVQERIASALKTLEDDPFRSRSGADIKKLSHTEPTKYRLRVGNYRIIYVVEHKTVKVIEVFKREKGYRDL